MAIGPVGSYWVVVAHVAAVLQQGKTTGQMAGGGGGGGGLYDGSWREPS